MIAPLTRERILKANNRLNQTIWKLDNSVKIFIQNRNYQLGRKEETVRHEFRNFAQLQLRDLERKTRTLSVTFRQITLAKHDQLSRKMQRSESLFRGALSDKKHYLELSLQMAHLTDPNKILARGYSITTYNGRALKDVDKVKSLELIETRLFNGQIISEVKTIKKDN
jgi:exodeoxyribonuclease VII large subunit